MKKILSVFLVLALTLSVFAGCGDEKTGENGTDGHARTEDILKRSITEQKLCGSISEIK